MRRNLKTALHKLGAAFAALAVAVSLAPAALAAPTSVTDVDDSKVTITGLLDGDTVSAYLIADADIDDTNNLTYTMAGNLPAAYDTIDELVAVTSDGYAFTQGTDMQNAAAAIAKSLSDAGVAAATTATASGTSAELTLGSGYYLVRVTSTNGETRVYQNMVVDVSPKANDGGTYDPHDDVSVAVKKTDVTVTKTVGANYTESTDEYSVGDEVPFKVETVIPSYPADSTNATFIIADTPSAGLEIVVSSIQVNGVDAASGAAYTIVATTGGYTITYNKDYILAHPGEAVTVTYNAKLTSAAFSHAADDVTGNTATVEFNPNPYENTTVTPGDDTTVQTYGYVFKKVDANGGDLAGATFTITLDNGEVLTSTSGSDGYIWFEDLAAGTYTATETVVPAGHLKAPDQTFTLSAATATADNPATAETENNYLVAAADVVDPDQPTLPTTGGAGTLIITAVGVGLLAVGGVVILRAQKKQREQ